MGPRPTNFAHVFTTSTAIIKRKKLGATRPVLTKAVLAPSPPCRPFSDSFACLRSFAKLRRSVRHIGGTSRSRLANTNWGQVDCFLSGVRDFADSGRSHWRGKYQLLGNCGASSVGFFCGLARDSNLLSMIGAHAPLCARKIMMAIPLGRGSIE